MTPVRGRTPARQWGASRTWSPRSRSGGGPWTPRSGPAPPRPVPGLAGVARGRDAIGARRPVTEAIGARRPGTGLRDAESTPPTLLRRPLSRALPAPPTRAHRPRFPPPHTCRGTSSRPGAPPAGARTPLLPGLGEGRGGEGCGAAARTVGEGTARRERAERQGGRLRVCAEGGGGEAPGPAPQRGSPSPPPAPPARSRRSAVWARGVQAPGQGRAAAGGAPFFARKGKGPVFSLVGPPCSGKLKFPSRTREVEVRRLTRPQCCSRCKLYFSWRFQTSAFCGRHREIGGRPAQSPVRRAVGTTPRLQGAPCQEPHTRPGAPLQA